MRSGSSLQEGEFEGPQVSPQANPINMASIRAGARFRRELWAQFSPLQPYKLFHILNVIAQIRLPSHGYARVLSYSNCSKRNCVCTVSVLDSPVSDGKVVHCELKFGESRLNLGESMEGWPEHTLLAQIFVADSDAVFV
jgi:hypothetical protein